MSDASGIYFIGLKFDIAVGSSPKRADELAEKYARFCQQYRKGELKRCPVGQLPCPFLLESDLAGCEYVTPNDWRKLMEAH